MAAGFAMAAAVAMLLAAAAPASHHHHHSAGVIAYATDRAMPGSGHYNIWTIHADGTHARQRTFATDSSLGRPHYSRDGKLIGFTDNTDLSGGAGIVFMHADGSHEHMVIPDDGGVYSGPSFGPKHEFVYSFADGIQPGVHLYLKSPHEDPQQLTTGSATEGEPAVSPNGKWIAYDADGDGVGQIWRVGTDGKHMRQLTHLQMSGHGPQLSPNGKLIVFECNKGSDYEICLMHANGSHEHRVTNTPGTAYEDYPAFSSSGKLITFSSTPSSPGKVDGTDSDLYTMRLDGTHRRPITTDDTFYDEAPVFQPGS